MDAVEHNGSATPVRERSARVGEALLSGIERWRERLAEAVARHNPGLSAAALNDAVQATIDRIVFLRICEDRGIEEGDRLRGLADGPGVYERLVSLFREAEERYNSGLFHFGASGDRERADRLPPSLEIPDEPLAGIIQELYPPRSPYLFDVIPPDILGRVYERFLGSVIHVSGDRRVHVERKPDLRKAGGVYYTPMPIVDYIVRNTVGELLKDRKLLGKTLEATRLDRPLRVCDPACGSGSFLLGAYQHLLDWYLEQYEADDPPRWARRRNPPIAKDHRDRWRLTVSERKRILTDHIFGVDIDAQAVEVTKLSLQLKVLHNETRHTLWSSLWSPREHALPDLGRNIRCGNALVGTDFDEAPEACAEADGDRVDPFDWERAFPGVFDEGGFDAVIGNPPYVFGQYHDERTRAYLERSYRTALDQYDTYWLFTEKACAIARQPGRISMIVPDALLARDAAQPVRELLLSNGLRRVYHCGPAFDAHVSAAVYVAEKGGDADTVVSEVPRGREPMVEHACGRSRFAEDEWRRLWVHTDDEQARVLRKVASGGRKVGDVVRVSRGEELGKKHLKPTGRVPILAGEGVDRYSVEPPGRCVDAIAKRPEIYEAPKLLVVKTGWRPIAAYDDRGRVTLQSIYNLHVAEGGDDPRTLLAVLNSTLAAFYVKKTFTEYKRLFPQLNQTTLCAIPLPGAPLREDAPAVREVERMQRLCEALRGADAPPERERIRRRIAAADRRIDRIVYGLYGLGGAEIRIVEEAVGGM